MSRAIGEELLGLAEGWVRLFANRAQPYAVQQADGSYRWVYEAATPQLVAAHLAGETTLAFSSTDARGGCRWACLDVDVPGSLPQLLALSAVLAELGLPGLVEASRRGGHLWLLLDEPVPVVVLRHAVAEALAESAAVGIEIPAHELYPDLPLGVAPVGSAPGKVGKVLGHAVRLPLGVHRKTQRRYPLFDARGLPCAFTTMETAAAFVLAVPRVVAGPLRERWQAFVADHTAAQKAAQVKRMEQAETVERAQRVQAIKRAGAYAAPDAPETHIRTRVGERVGTHSTVIRWVDAQISPLELLVELAPDAQMRRAGRGYIGWCPFHDGATRSC